MKSLNWTIGGRITFTKQIRKHADGYVPVKRKINCKSKQRRPAKTENPFLNVPSPRF